MRQFLKQMSICAILAGFPSQVFAVEPVLAELTPASVTGPEEKSLLSFIVSDIAQRSAGLAAKAPKVKLKKGEVPPENPEADWLSDLSAYYTTAGARPHWVDQNGFRPSAVAAIEEMQRAGGYGLEPSKFSVPWLPTGAAGIEELAAAEVKLSLALARYAWHARGGRFAPTQLSMWLDYKPRRVNAASLAMELSVSTDIAAAMRAMHPAHNQFEALRKELAVLVGPPSVEPGKIAIPMGVRIKPGQRHPDVALVRQRLSMPAYGDETLLDNDLLEAVTEFMANAGIPYGRRRGIDDDARIALNGGKKVTDRGNKSRINLILANMERWRWLPRDFGSLYIWNNLPEFETRVIKDGVQIHAERIIIGEPGSQTPVFSDSMTRVIFKPDWTVPESIKLSSLWSNLRGGDYGVLKRRNMRIIHEGKEIKPQKIKWGEVSARDIPIVQGPGEGNPLGDYKFVFPNKHDVYMHDTTSKHLFESGERTFSHGCIRVKNPQRFAEVVLGEAKNWKRADVAWQSRTKTTVRIELDKHIPIHNTYFTLVADASGTLKTLKDVYGHDKRIIDALAGIDPKKIGASDPALALKQRNEQLADSAPVKPRRRVARNRPNSLVAARRLPPPARTATRPSQPFFYYAPPPPPPRYYTSRQGVFRAPPRGLFIFR